MAYQSDLFVDIGHSAVKWRTFNSEVSKKCIENFSANNLPNSECIWLSAVAHPNMVDSIQTEFANVELVLPSKKYGNLTIAYETPSNLGVDRFLAMVGAIEHFPRTNLLVVDLGSALTIDIINDDGIHQGGLIMPGLKALRTSFAKFSTDNMSRGLTGLQSNTKDAWLNGTEAMLISTIKEQIRNFQSQYPNGAALLTGGGISKLSNELPQSLNYFENLVLDGLESYAKSVG
jgi:type III pantothenate kinase